MMVQARSTFWFGLKSSNSWPWLCDPDWDPVQCPRPIFWTDALSLNPVRSGQTWRFTSRPQLRSKSDLIPGKSLFLALCTSGMATQQSGAVLFYSRYPPNTSRSRYKKDKKPAYFCQSPSLFSFYSKCGSQEWVQLTGTQWVSVSTFFSANRSSLKAAERSSFTMTFSNRWPYWVSIDWAVFTISWKSSSCMWEQRGEKTMEVKKRHKPWKAVHFRLPFCYEEKTPATVNKRRDNSHIVNTNYTALNTQINIKWPVRSPL